MVHRDSIPSGVLGTSSSIVENAITRSLSEINQNSTPENPVFDSGKATPSIVQKADAVLNDELKSRAGQSAEKLVKSSQSEPAGLESAIEESQKQASNLGNTVVKALGNPIEQPAHVASQLARVGELTTDARFTDLSSLKFPHLVSPGNASRIPFTLINDDPKEPADFTLYTTDLFSKSGHSIPEAEITVHPKSGRIEPSDSIDGHLEIRVPAGTPPGSYDGLLQTEDTNELRAPVQLSVGP